VHLWQYVNLRCTIDDCSDQAAVAVAAVAVTVTVHHLHHCQQQLQHELHCFIIGVAKYVLTLEYMHHIIRPIIRIIRPIICIIRPIICIICIYWGVWYVLAQHYSSPCWWLGAGLVSTAFTSAKTYACAKRYSESWICYNSKWFLCLLRPIEGFSLYTPFRQLICVRYKPRFFAARCHPCLAWKWLECQGYFDEERSSCYVGIQLLHWDPVVTLGSSCYVEIQLLRCDPVIMLWSRFYVGIQLLLLSQ
jgi:hypothetical protein